MTVQDIQFHVEIAFGVREFLSVYHPKCSHSYKMLLSILRLTGHKRIPQARSEATNGGLKPATLAKAPAVIIEGIPASNMLVS